MSWGKTILDVSGMLKSGEVTMRKTLKIALAALMATAMPATAEAAIVITSYGFSDGSRTGTLHHSPTGRTVSAGIGRFALTGLNQVSMEQVNYLSYCLDIFNPLHNGAFTLQSLSTVLANPIKLSQINAVLSHGDPLVTGANASAGVQLAIWEILYESGTSGYNIDNGDFRVTGGTSGTARTYANMYLNWVLGGTWAPETGREMAVLYALDNQTQLITARVPEPATWAMMLGGFGLVGAGIRRRGRQAAIVLA